MSKTTCEIVFDNNPNRVYYGGQTVSGTVTLTLHKEKTVKGKICSENVFFGSFSG